MDKLIKNSISLKDYEDTSENAVVLENFIDCDSEKNQLNQDCGKNFESIVKFVKFVKCPFCELPCSSEGLKSHVEQNHPKYPSVISAKNSKVRSYVCFICNARYSDKGECRQHMLSHREKNGTYTNGTTCQEITQKINSGKSTHLKSMAIEDKPGDRCKNYISTAESTNIKVIKEYVNNRCRMIFDCGTCRSKFLYYHQLQNHLKIGSCKNVIENKSALIEHKSLIHSIKNVCSLCLFCQVTFSSEYMIRQHISQHHSSFLIQIFNQQEQQLIESITSMFYLSDSTDNRTSMFYSSDSTDNSSTIRYSCILCEMSYSDEICVREHILEHHSNMVLEEFEYKYKSFTPLIRMFYSSEPVTDSLSPGHECYLCGMRCTNKDKFKQHLLSHTEKEQCCNECGRRLKAAKIMCVNKNNSAHVEDIFHEFNKILKCPICTSGICSEKCFKTHLSKKHLH